jgi:hypothetical protein
MIRKTAPRFPEKLMHQATGKSATQLICPTSLGKYSATRRRKGPVRLSFRGASETSEPGIHNHRACGLPHSRQIKGGALRCFVCANGPRAKRARHYRARWPTIHYHHAPLWLWIPGSALAGCPGMTAQLICRTSQAKLAHARHAEIARRANLSQGFWIAETPKSPAHLPVPRLREGRYAIVTSVGRGMRWT